MERAESRHAVGKEADTGDYHLVTFNSILQGKGYSGQTAALDLQLNAQTAATSVILFFSFPPPLFFACAVVQTVAFLH